MINLAIRKKEFIFKDIKLEILLKDEIKFDFQGDFIVNGKQIGILLGYKRSRDAISNHVHKDDKFIVKNADILKDNSDAVKHRFRKLNNRGETFINESGMYALIFGSKLKQAIEFKRWVTSELLPTIRKTGGYIHSTKKFIAHYFKGLSEEDQKLIYMILKSKNEQNKKIEKQKKKLKEQKPKVKQYNKYINFENQKTVTAVAKILDVGRNKLFRFLRNQKILMNGKGPGSKKNIPYQRYINSGYFKVKPKIINRDKGKDFEVDVTLVTKKGIDYIYKKIEENKAWKRIS